MQNQIDRLNAYLASAEFLDLWIAMEGAKSGPGVFFGDSMFAWGRNLGFLSDRDLRRAFEQGITTYGDASTQHVANELIWRKHVLLWCARNALAVPGDFAECGVSVGFGVDVLTRALNFAQVPKTYWLYDTFDGVPPSQADEGSPGKYGKAETILELVRAKFQHLSNVRIVPGMLPDSLADGAPESLAFLHVDLNNSAAELATLAALLPRISLGGYLVLDDFGWGRFGRQHSTQSALFEHLQLPVLELPTGQAIVQVTKAIDEISPELLEQLKHEEPAELTVWPTDKAGGGADWNDVIAAEQYLKQQIKHVRSLLSRKRPENGDAASALARAEVFSTSMTDGSVTVSRVETTTIDKPHLVRALLQREIDSMAATVEKLQSK